MACSESLAPYRFGQNLSANMDALVVADITVALEVLPVVSVGRRQTSRDGPRAVHVTDEPGSNEGGGWHGTTEHGDRRP